MKIYTKGGDRGKTSLLSGKRVFKNQIRIDTYGTFDELNSYIGLIINLENMNQHENILREIQNKIFQISSILANDSDKIFLEKINEKDVILLETNIDIMDKELPELKSFILAGTSINNAHINIARSISRRAERKLVELMQIENIDDVILMYINRLSDYLFQLGRHISNKYDNGDLLKK